MNKMTYPIRLSVFLLAAILFQFCSEEDSFAPQSHTVQFAFSLDENASAVLPPNSKVVLSISTSSGQVALTNHVVGIQPSDNGFITDPLPLAEDEYLITDFMVVHDDVALYVTPKSGSKFSDRVTAPLSYQVSLRHNIVLPLQVVTTKNGLAKEFGYTSLRVSSPEWRIMVFTRENGVLEKSAAWVFLRTTGISYGSLLLPKMNTLSFEGDPAHTYTLIVEKDGYETYKADFVYEEVQGNGNKPFKVILDRVQNEYSFTITPPKAEGEFNFKLGLRGTGSLSVDWGDGTTETVNFEPDPALPGGVSYLTPVHEYIAPLPDDGHQISITGDLNQIFLYESISVYASDIDPRNLDGLQIFSLEGASINGLLDLSSNSQLKSIRFVGTNVWEIRLPESHEISEVLLTAEFSQPVVDMVIANIYENAVSKDVTGGTVTILPPLELSAASAQKVQVLVDDYGWELREME